MALSKIELKLGKKVISLTPEQFEELKQDMRNLDKQHNYYWCQSPWYRQWYNQSPSLVLSTDTNGSITSQTETGLRLSSGNGKHVDVGIMDIMSNDDEPNPPSFSGSILSTE